MVGFEVEDLNSKVGKVRGECVTTGMFNELDGRKSGQTGNYFDFTLQEHYFMK